MEKKSAYKRDRKVSAGIGVNPVVTRAAKPHAELRLIGAPSFTISGNYRPLPRKAFVLFAILILSPGMSASRARLRSILWGDSTDVSAGANLRQLLSRLVKVERETNVKLLEIQRQSIRLERTGAAIDLLSYVPPAPRLSTSDSSAQLSLIRGYVGELLAEIEADNDVLDEWLSQERANLKNLFVMAAVNLLQKGTGSQADDLDVASRLIAVDPTQEAAWCTRIKIYGARGDISRSRAAYLECESVLKKELDVAPSAETRALAARFFDETASPVMPVVVSPPRPRQKIEGDRPRVAILPPVDPFDKPRLRRLANFLLEEVTIGLARYRSFRVIAAHTAIALSSGAVARLNGDWYDYALASSLSGKGTSFELKYSLSDHSSGTVLWAASLPFDGTDLPGLFSMMSDKAITALADTIEQRELERPVPAADKTAYQMFLEGRHYANSTDLRDIRRARRLLREATAKDANFAGSYAGVARTYSMEWLIRGGGSETGLLHEALKFANQAITVDSRDARGFHEKGFALLYLKQHDESLAMFSEAASRNPNDADLLMHYADALGHAGDPSSALTVMERAMEINPVPPPTYFWVLGSLHYQLGHYRKALTALDPVKHNPSVARLLTACTAQLGDLTAAKAYAYTLQEQFPDFRVNDLWSLIPNRLPSDTEHLIEGLRRAGFS